MIEIERKFRVLPHYEDTVRDELIPSDAEYRIITNRDYYFYKPGNNHFIRYREDFGNCEANPTLTFKEEKMNYPKHKTDPLVREEYNFLLKEESTSNKTKIKNLAKLLGYSTKFDFTKCSIIFNEGLLEISYYTVYCSVEWMGDFIEIEYKGKKTREGKKLVNDYCKVLKDKLKGMIYVEQKSLCNIYLNSKGIGNIDDK